MREIETLIRARYPILYVISWEERRVEEDASKDLRRYEPVAVHLDGHRRPSNRRFRDPW